MDVIFKASLETYVRVVSPWFGLQDYLIPNNIEVRHAVVYLSILPCPSLHAFASMPCMHCMLCLTRSRTHVHVQEELQRTEQQQASNAQRISARTPYFLLKLTSFLGFVSVSMSAVGFVFIAALPTCGRSFWSYVIPGTKVCCDCGHVVWMHADTSWDVVDP